MSQAVKAKRWSVSDVGLGINDLSIKTPTSLGLYGTEGSLVTEVIRTFASH